MVDPGVRVAHFGGLAKGGHELREALEVLLLRSETLRIRSLRPPKPLLAGREEEGRLIVIAARRRRRGSGCARDCRTRLPHDSCTAAEPLGCRAPRRTRVARVLRRLVPAVVLPPAPHEDRDHSDHDQAEELGKLRGWRQVAAGRGLLFENGLRMGHGFLLCDAREEIKDEGVYTWGGVVYSLYGTPKLPNSDAHQESQETATREQNTTFQETPQSKLNSELLRRSNNPEYALERPNVPTP